MALNQERMSFAVSEKSRARVSKLQRSKSKEGVSQACTKRKEWVVRKEIEI